MTRFFRNAEEYDLSTPIGQRLEERPRCQAAWKQQSSIAKTHQTGIERPETQTDIPNKRNTRPRYHTEPLTSVKHILRQLHHSKHHTVSNHEAALRLEPSATLIASIVHLALLRLRTGIASFHLTTWASNGSYPFFLNAFAHLPPRLRKRMGPIRRTFGDGAVPHPAQIDWTTDLLILARVREAAAE